MQDKTLLNISLITSVIGLIALFLIMYFYEIPQVTSLDNSAIDSKVKVIGEITKISKTNKTTRITINTSCLITGVIFEDNSDNNNNNDSNYENKSNTNTINNVLKQNNVVILEGKVQEYNNKKELLVDKFAILQ